MPTRAELVELKEVLRKHAFASNAVRQFCALGFVFECHEKGGESCQTIKADEILRRCPDKAAVNPKEAVHRLMADIGLKLDAFYGEGSSSGKLPHPEALKLKYRAVFRERGNYALNFLPYHPKKTAPDLIPSFWNPHLPPHGKAKILYVEPLFMMDEQRTFFRNAAMGTQPDASSLSYLNVSGSLKPGYSYVPSGVVQALLLLTKAIRHCDNHWPDVPACEALKPSVSVPPYDHDLIVLATPTSTELVATIQDGQQMTVDAGGVHFKGETHNDDDHMQWGVVTRTRQDHRVITLLAARHGRSVEAMAKVLARHDPLALVLQRMGRVSFPECFQVMFRMPVVNTREGPSVRDAMVADVFVHEEPEAEASSAATG